MNDHIFPIGFWNVLPATQFGVEGVKDWLDFGSTLTMTGFYDLETDKEKMLAILDECHKKNLKIIFNDRRITFNNYHAEDFRQIMQEDIDIFASHPAVYGFYLGDEPVEEQMEDTIATVKLFKELCPQKKAFVNLLPWVPWLNDSGLIAASQDNYEDHLINFLERTGLDILSYDCYMQMCESSHGVLDATALDAYYYNLRIFKSAAAKTGAELWYTTLAVGHGMYKCPNQDDFRWEINTAVAHGVKSLFYWYFYADSYNFNYRNHPINQLFERTETFRWCSTENRIFQEVYGAVFCELEHEKTYHSIKAYGGFPLLEESNDEFISHIKTNVGTPMIVSRFTNEKDPDHIYYAIVNNSQCESLAAHIYFNQDVHISEVRGGGDCCALIDMGNRKKGEEITYYYSPGQMWVFAIRKA